MTQRTALSGHEHINFTFLFWTAVPGYEHTNFTFSVLNGSFRPWHIWQFPAVNILILRLLLFHFYFYSHLIIKMFCFELKIKEKLIYFQFNGKENSFSFWFGNWLSFVIVEDYHLCIYSNFEGLRNIPFRNSFVLNCLGTVTYSLSP